MLRRVAFAIALMLAAPADPTYAQRQQASGATWELLGETRVGFGVTRDVVSIGQAEGFFRNRSYEQLRLAVDQGDVKMSKLRLRYINGFEEEVPVDNLVHSGQSIIVPLPERRSFLAQIDLVYSGRAEPGTGGLITGWTRPRMKVYGLNLRAGLPPSSPNPNWVSLSESPFSLRGNRHVIRLRMGEQWYRTRIFDRLHLQATEGEVDITEIRIVYINGYAETIRVGRGLKSGADLAVDLPGQRSYLRQIEIFHRPLPPSATRGALRVFGERRPL